MNYAEVSSTESDLDSDEEEWKRIRYVRCRDSLDNSSSRANDLSYVIFPNKLLVLPELFEFRFDQLRMSYIRFGIFNFCLKLFRYLVRKKAYFKYSDLSIGVETFHPFRKLKEIPPTNQPTDQNSLDA